MFCKECVHYEVCENYLNEFGESIVVPVGIVRNGLLGIMKTKCPFELKIERDPKQVVRCKDCLYFENGKNHTSYCTNIDGLYEPEKNDFCSYGERRK